jgi:anaerobic selenocysteine-containing dehydrogenase
VRPGHYCRQTTAEDATAVPDSGQPARSARAGREIVHSVCPHDCPSTCALEVERLDARTIGAVRGAEANTYTQGVICAKVARYAERIHHPGRVIQPLRRVGARGDSKFVEISWDDALDEVANAFIRATQK